MIVLSILANFSRILLFIFSVCERCRGDMEKSILVPQSLHDMVLSKSGDNPVQSVKGIVSDKNPYEAFNALKNVKNVVLTGHSLDDKSDGHLISRELQYLTKPLVVMTDLANSLTAEYKKNFNLLF